MKKFLLRVLLGICFIVCINYFLEYKGIDLHVGINLISSLTTGVLGFPGIVLLYGVSAITLL